MVAYAMISLLKAVQIHCVVALKVSQIYDIGCMARFVLTPTHHHSQLEVIRAITKALQNKK